jgi:hypothetical protein
MMAGIYGEPSGLFTEQTGTFKEAGGMFKPDGSQQQERAFTQAARQGRPTALDPMTPAIKSPSAPLNIGAPFEKRGVIYGADLSLSPRLSDPAFSIERLSGRLGML